MTTIQIFTIVATMVGGLALFLFGMNTMSDSLSSMTGGVLDRIVGLVTKNRWLAFVFGTLLTAVVQSSSVFSHHGYYEGDIQHEADGTCPEQTCHIDFNYVAALAEEVVKADTHQNRREAECK